MKRRNQKNKLKLGSIFMTLGVIIILLLAGPAQAFNITLQNSKSDLEINETISFLVTLDIEDYERLPVEEVRFNIEPAGINCIFDTQGQIISGCDNFNIELLSSPTNTQGNLTGNYSDIEYNWGYGYGYGTDTQLKYNLTFTGNLSAGTYSTAIRFKVGGNYFNKAGNDFTIATAPTLNELTIYSPLTKSYSSKSIPFNITTENIVSEIRYRNNNNTPATWKSLCKNCDSYGFSGLKKEVVKEGQNNLEFAAITLNGTIFQETVNIFVDSIKPRVGTPYPSGTKFVNGSEFYVFYTEANLRNITLYYNASGILGSQTKEDCLSGTNKKCSFSLDLSAFNNQKLDYWLEVNDGLQIGNSKKVNVNIDTVAPIINSLNSNVLNKIIRVEFNITETNFDKITYLDNNSQNYKKPRVLCSKLSNDKCSGLITFSGNSPDITFQVLDKAGNSVSTNIN